MKTKAKGILVFICLLISSCNQISNNVTGSIHGTVYSTSGSRSISGVIVECEGRSDTTTEEGKYRISDIAIGTSNIKATKSDFEPFSKSVQITSSGTSLDIYMTPNVSGASVWGYIKSTDGQPVSGANVTISNMVDTTDANGRYQLPSIPQGSQSITVSAIGYETKSQTFFMYSSDKQIDINIRKEYVTDFLIDKDTSVNSNGYTRSGTETVLSGNNCLHKRTTIYLHSNVSIPVGSEITALSLGINIISTNVNYNYNWLVATISQDWSEYNMNNTNEPSISSYYLAPCISVSGTQVFLNLKSSFDNNAYNFYNYGVNIKPVYNDNAVDWIGIDIASRENANSSKRPFIRVNYLH